MGIIRLNVQNDKFKLLIIYVFPWFKLPASTYSAFVYIIITKKKLDLINLIYIIFVFTILV